MTTPSPAGGAAVAREAPSQSFAPQVYTLTTRAQNVRGADPNSRGVLIVNTGLTTVYLSATSSASIDACWPLTPAASVGSDGGGLVVNTAAAIFARVLAPDAAGSVKVLAESGWVC